MLAILAGSTSETCVFVVMIWLMIHTVFVMFHGMFKGHRRESRRQLHLEAARRPVPCLSAKKWKDVNNNNNNINNNDYTTTSAPCSCPICLTSFQENDMVSSCQSCRQPYHRHCLQEWLGKADGCPTCRVVFVTTTSTQEEEEYETRTTTNKERRSSSSSFSSTSSSKTTNRYEQ